MLCKEAFVLRILNEFPAFNVAANKSAHQFYLNAGYVLCIVALLISYRLAPGSRWIERRQTTYLLTMKMETEKTVTHPCR